MRFYLNILFLLFFTYFPKFLSSQEYIANIQHYSIEDGLSHREVFAIHQDSRGFVWLGTKYGLNRFDGKEFRWWTKEKNGLASNEIHQIIEDADGYLWVTKVTNWFHKEYPQSVSLVNIQTGRVLSLEQRFGSNLPFKTSEIFRIVSDDKRNLFISTINGVLYSYQPDIGFKSIPFSHNHKFHILYATKRETIWGYLSPGDMQVSDLIEINLQGELVYSKKQNDKSEFLDILGLGPKDNILFSTFGDQRCPELYSLSSGQTPLQFDYLSFLESKTIDCIGPDWSQRMFYQSDRHFFWFKSSPHFFVFHPDKGMMYNFQDRYKYLIDADIHTIYFDNSGIIWIGTAHGLYQLELKANPFISYLNMDFQQYSVNDAYSCRGIWANDQNLFVNTYKGRIQIDLFSDSIERLPSLQFTEVNGIQKTAIYFPLAVFKDADNDLWFSEYTLAHRSISSKSDKHFTWNKEHTYDNNIWSIYQDREGKIWVGSEKGLGFLDETDGHIKSFPVYNGFKDINNSFVHAFVQSKEGHIWIATSSGLYVWQPKEGVKDRYWTGGKGDHYLPHDNILHLHEDKDKIIWLATGGGGLIRLKTPANILEPTTGNQPSLTKTHFDQFTIADGLSNNNLYAVYEDQWNKLWMSSDYGIIQFDKSTYKAKAYLPRDGVTHQEFNRISHFQAGDGTLYFGGLNGVTAFHPRDFRNREVGFDASLQITDFQQFDNNSSQLVDRTNELLEHRKIILKPGDRLFRLQFALLDFQNTDQIHYAWKIDGIDDNWNFIRENFIRISGLPYGNFTLKVKGQATDGRWSAQELHIPVTVLKPFYLQTWILLLGGLLFFIMVLTFFKLRTAQLKKRQQVLEQQVNERTKTIEEQAEELRQLDKQKTRFFANISHELRTPLTLILGPLDLVLNWNDLPDRVYSKLKMIRQNSRRLHRLVNEILDINKLEVNKLELHEHPVELYKYLRRILSSFESYAQFREIEFTFRHDFDRHLKILLDESKFEKILHNLLSNAFKFTPRGGEVSVHVEDMNSIIKLEVTDSGPGIHPDDLPNIFNRFYQSQKPGFNYRGGTGIGLSLSSQYAKMLGGKLFVSNDPDTNYKKRGSTFCLEFPKKEIFGSIENKLPVAGSQNSSSSEISELISMQETEGNINRHPEKILIVEDNPDMQVFLRSILSPLYAVQIVENGKEALEALGKGISKTNVDHPDNIKHLKNIESLNPVSENISLQNQLPDLVISDVMMPVMDGFALLERLKINKEYRHLPVILLTARAGLEDKIRALRIGVDDYLTKPFEIEELLVRIRNLLHNYRERLHWQQEPKLDSLEIEEESTYSLDDQNWLDEFELRVKQASADPGFSIKQLAKNLVISERQLQRKLKQLTGLTPLQYLREIRLEHARQLLEDRKYPTVSEIAYKAGFSDPKYFSRSFKNRFGKAPSAYL